MVVAFRKTGPLKQVAQAMAQARDYQIWREAALRHDELSGMEDWKRRDNTELYDAAEIRIRHDKLRQLIDSGQSEDLLYALNEGIHGNVGGMGKPILYNRAKEGTKYLINDYVQTMVEALWLIAEADDASVSLHEKVDFFRRASHCYGRSALLMSGGAGLIYYHHGVVQTLIDEDLLPNVLSGASAGSWMCAQIGTHTDEELKNGYFNKQIYDIPMGNNAFDFIAGGEDAINPTHVKEQAIDGFCNDMTFQEAFEHTGRYINVTIAPAGRHQTSRLMNAITSPNVYIKSAVDASSSIPGLFPAVTLYAKGRDGKPKPYLPSRKWVDGSLAEDLPTKRLSRLYGVNHYIVSMINPAAVFFTNEKQGIKQLSLREMVSTSMMHAAKSTLSTFENYVARAGLTQLSPAILFAHSVFDQDYTGDINMILRKKHYKWRNVWFHFNSESEIHELSLAGKRDTWPKLQMIRNNTLVAKTLDEILETMDLREFSHEHNLPKHLTPAT